MFHGSITACITPFKKGKVDKQAFKRIIEWQIAEGTHGIVPCGTTGESPTLNHDEHNEVIELCVKYVKGRIPVIAGTGSNSTSEAIMMTKHAEKAGADSALIMTPYYNKPTQEGVFQHFKAIHNATKIPIILYNIPGRSVVDMKDETILRMAEMKRIVGIKDATGDLSRPVRLKKLGVKKDFILLSGDDETAVEFNKLGGVGAISVTSNIAPKLCSQMQEATLKGDFKKAEAIQKKLMPLHKAMFVETSPGPVKYAAGLMDLCSDEMRLPLVLPSKENKEKIKSTLKTLGLV